jgi:crotonobetainyl-CoA:carnitine CoA-transferase CaiB-like acyl-CoA transferase
MMQLPLEGLVVLEFSQYLSGPSAGLRLADLGAQVIKIEKHITGDAGRKLAIKNLWVDDSSLLFHSINRNKNSVTADLKNAADVVLVKKLIEKADVMMHNFRPGIMQKIGLDYAVVKAINPIIIYAEISGYGTKGPWKHKPGQDLLLQSITGLTFTTGNANQSPMPFGIAIGDLLSGAQLVQGILAALIRRQKKQIGALIEVSIMESLIDLQFELLTTYFCNNQQPLRSNINNGHPLLSAPYGIYNTQNGYIALAMIDLYDLAKAIHCDALYQFTKEDIFSKRDEIKSILAAHLSSEKASHWLQLLQANDLWAMEVLDWDTMKQNNAYQILQMEQILKTDAKDIITTRCPIKINGQILVSQKSAPKIGNTIEQSVYL